MPEFIISFLLDILIVLMNFLLLLHVLLLFLNEGSHADARILKEILTDDIGTESRLLHLVRRRCEDNPAVTTIVLLLGGSCGA